MAAEKESLKYIEDNKCVEPNYYPRFIAVKFWSGESGRSSLVNHGKSFVFVFAFNRNSLNGKSKKNLPELKEKTAQCPVHRVPETSSKYSISAGETCPDMVSALKFPLAGFFRQGQLPAPWQLKTPITPVHLFKFHIFRRLYQNPNKLIRKKRKIYMQIPCADNVEG